MKRAAMMLIFFAVAGMSVDLCAQPGDWYSRGIIRQQTVDLMITRQKREDYDSFLSKLGRMRIVGKPGRFAQTSSNSKRSGSLSNPTASDQDTVFHSVGPAFVPHELAIRLGGTSQERQYIEDVLTKCLTFYTETARQKGVPLNDVARALNYYISTNYFVYTLGAGPTRDQMDATRKMIRDNMAQDETFRRMTDREKQEIYETLIVLAGFVDLGFGTAEKSGNKNMAAQFRDMAKHNLETFLGAPVEQIQFTSAGLEVR
jgi:hypothetical protein